MGVMSHLEEENKVVVGELFFGCKLQRLNSKQLKHMHTYNKERKKKETR